MIETRVSRLVILSLLVGVLVVLSVGFGVSSSQGPRPGQPPTVDHLALSDGAYVGQSVEVSGEVVRTDPVVVVAEYERWTGERYRTGLAGFTVTGLDAAVSRGQSLQVYGTLVAEERIEATNGVVVPAGNVLFMFGVSALAGLWVLARLVRGWTVDSTTLAFEPRGTPAPSGSTDSPGSEGSTDA